MPSRKDLRVIEGGKGGDASPDALAALTMDEFRERALQLRLLLALSSDEKAFGMVDDMDEVIGVLSHLELANYPYAPQRAAECRDLIAEIDAEILAVLKDT